MPPIGTLKCKLAGASSTSAHLAVQLIPSTSKNVGPGVITSKAEFQERDSGHVGYDGYDRARNLMPLRLSSAEVAACHSSGALHLL